MAQGGVAVDADAIDGIREAAYGAPTATVLFSATAPNGNFGSPSNVNTTGYNIYLHGDEGYVYGFIESATASGLPFANLYFDLDYATRSGSDLGFQLSTGNQNPFIPGGTNGAPVGDILTALSADGTGFEFAIPVSYFTGPVAGLVYNPALTFPTIGESVRLNLSQSFGYAVAGGADFYGADRLGLVELTAVPVPEAQTWTLMILGFGAVGASLRRRGARTLA